MILRFIVKVSGTFISEALSSWEVKIRGPVFSGGTIKSEIVRVYVGDDGIRGDFV